MHLSKKLGTVLMVVVAVIFIAVGIWIGLSLVGNRAESASVALSPYSAVYLSTGDIYFGKLDWFPTPHIENAWFLQWSTDAKGNSTVGVYPFNQVAWGPAGDVYLNSKQIILWTRLASTSTIAQTMENRSAATAAAAAQQNAPITQTPTVTASTTLPYAPYSP